MSESRAAERCWRAASCNHQSGAAWAKPVQASAKLPCLHASVLTWRAKKVSVSLTSAENAVKKVLYLSCGSCLRLTKDICHCPLSAHLVVAAFSLCWRWLDLDCFACDLNYVPCNHCAMSPLLIKQSLLQQGLRTKCGSQFLQHRAQEVAAKNSSSICLRGCHRKLTNCPS